MTITPLENFAGLNECEMIDGKTRVNAYTDLYLDPENPTGIVLDTTWGEVHVDLKDVVKNGETITHLKLSPADAPTVLRYEREDGGVDCITGEELSKIIYLRYLADVEQPHTLQTGEILKYSAGSDTFKYFNLDNALANIDTAISNLQNTVNQLNNTVSSLSARVAALETLTTRPAGIPNDTVLCWGNINSYGDVTNSNLKTSGLYTHSTSTDKVNDQYFS